MDLATRLNAIVETYDLNKHPFYVEWRAGTLPQETLRTYAEEYGQLVALMPQPWTLLGDESIAQEERDHMVMWDSFAECLSTSVPDVAKICKTAEMVEVVSELFSSKATAIGALYAFEVQQPGTATSKLEGLMEHYPQLDRELYTEYFEVHSRNHHESEALVEMMAALSDNDRKTAIDACERMCKALWDTLTGIHGDSTSCSTVGDA